MRRFPATFFIVLLSVLIQAVACVFPGVAHVLAFRPADGILGWLGIITYQVTHGGWAHLLGNFSFGLPFMLFLEHELGRRRFEQYYLFCGICSALLQLYMVGPPGLVGSSGSIFGVMIGACLAFGDTVAEHLLALAVLLALFIPQLQAAPVASLFGIAVYGHIGGAVGGAVGGMLLSTYLFNSREQK